MNNRDNENDTLLKGIKIATHKKSSVTSVFDVFKITFPLEISCRLLVTCDEM